MAKKIKITKPYRVRVRVMQKEWKGGGGWRERGLKEKEYITPFIMAYSTEDAKGRADMWYSGKYPQLDDPETERLWVTARAYTESEFMRSVGQPTLLDAQNLSKPQYE